MAFEPLDQYLQRKKKLGEIAALGEDPYPHRFDQTATPAEILAKYAEADAQALESERVNVRLAGRILTLRLHGKTGFAHIQGAGARLQIMSAKTRWATMRFAIRIAGHGDGIGVSGYLFRTKTNELTPW